VLAIVKENITFMTIARISYPKEIANKITTEFTGDVILPNISWQTYEAMLVDMGDRVPL